MAIPDIKSNHKYAMLSIIAITIAIILRLYLVSIYAISGDACWHFSAAKFIAMEGKFPLFEEIGRDEPFWAPPLFHIVASFFYLIFGELGLKLVAPLFGSLTLLVSYLIFRKFLSDRASFYAILFLSFIPIFVDYSILGYVESLLTFLVALSIYFALNDRFILSGTAAGLAILAKYNGLFVIPVLIFIAYKNSDRRIVMKNFMIVSITPLIIGLPWLIRNWVLLGNPVWPFLNFVFNGFQRLSFSTLNISNLVSIKTYIAAYLGFFGVPDGNYKLLFFFDVPYMWVLLPIFFIATLAFILPLFFGFKKGKAHQVFYALLISFSILFMLYVVNVGIFVSRVLLPAVIAVAFIYGSGFESIAKKFSRFEKIMLLLVIIMVIGFSAVETAKFKFAADSWNFYKEDFEWVKSNTGKEDIFLVGGQCIQYHISRKSLFPSLEIGSDKYDYVWVNLDFKLEPQSILSSEELNKLKGKNMQLVYSNKKTGTKVYSIIR